MPTLQQLAHRFYRDQRGAAALTYLICLPVITLALLSAVDFIRYNLAQNKLQNALDITVLSAGRHLEYLTPEATDDDKSAWRENAIGYFYSNMPHHFLGSTIQKEDVHIDYQDESHAGQQIAMSASGTLPLLVTGYFNKTAFHLNVKNKAVRHTRNDIEMVLALDHTGSMDGEKIKMLKKSSNELVDTLLGAAQRDGKFSGSFIGIVPFADTVYVGNDRLHWLTPTTQDSPYVRAGLWDGCVVEPYDGSRFNAQPGMPAQFTPLMTWGSHTFTPEDVAEKTHQKSDEIGITRIHSHHIIDSQKQQDGAIKARFAFPSRYIQGGKSHANCSNTRALVFLNNHAETLKQNITDLSVNGRTIIPLGLLWSWRMLDPNWRGNHGWEDEMKPRDAAPGLNKIIVLLTDGNNGLDPLDPNDPRYHHDDVAIDANPLDISYTLTYQLKHDNTRASSLQGMLHQFTNDKHLMNKYFANSSDVNSLHIANEEEMKTGTTARLEPYGTLYQKRNGGQDWEVGNVTLNRLTAELCENIKQQNIKIYTIVLGGGINDNTKTLMQQCSSGEQHGYYFDATNIGSLSSAFNAIASSLTELRLVE